LSIARPADRPDTRLRLMERFTWERFTRGERAKPGPVLLSHRRIFILPTRAGLICGITLAVMLLASIIYNNNPGFILTFLLGSVCLVSILHNFRSMTGLRVTTELCAPVFAGETAHYRVRIENPTSSERLNLEASLKGQPPVAVSVPEKSTVTLSLPLKTSRRGWLNPGTVTLVSRYPLGLFRAWSPLNFSASILVYPKPAKTPQALQARAPIRGGAKNLLEDNEDFSGLSEYQPGDSLRKIHWKAYAKGQGLLVRQYRGGQMADLWFDLDRTPGASLEDRLSRLCRCITDAERSGLAYGLKIPGFEQKPGHGIKQRSACLKALALF
jgi:uncharacterized protein (DUF58 family)